MEQMCLTHVQLAHASTGTPIMHMHTSTCSKHMQDIQCQTFDRHSESPIFVPDS